MKKKGKTFHSFIKSKVTVKTNILQDNPEN